MEWKDQYKHPLWQKKRLEALEGAEYMCERCCDKDAQLHVHHKRYVKGRMIWEYKTSELLVLCAECHESTHGEKDVFGYMLSQLPVSAYEELIPLVAGYFYGRSDAPDFDADGPLSYIGYGPESTAGSIAHELCMRAHSNKDVNLEGLLEMIVDSRTQGKRIYFYVDGDETGPSK